MKRLFTILAIAIVGVTALPTFANNWQWQLDQIKADQQRRVKCHAAEQAKRLKEKMTDVDKKPDTGKAAQPVATPQGK